MTLRRWCLGAAALLGVAAHADADPVPPTAVVQFNTVCVGCHEGECSGRLSFSSGEAAALSHIRRYIPDATDTTAHALFTQLRYTKEQCRHYPVAYRVPPDGIWRAADLVPWRNPRTGGYFVPLGPATVGDYQLALGFADQAQATVRVTDEAFDLLLEERPCPADAVTLGLHLEQAAHLYLTVDTATPLQELRLGAVPAPPPSR